MQTTKHVEYLQIGGQTTGLSARATNPTTLLTGEIGIFTAEGVTMTEATAATSAGNRFIIATKLADGTIVRSPEYSKADIKSCTRKVYTAGTVQTDYVGYNGTTGSIDVINDNSYKINLQIQELLRSNSDGRKVKFGIYKSSSSATQAEIASALTKSLFQNFEREAEKFIVFTMLGDHAGAAIGAAADTVVGNLGSNKVVITDTGGDTSVNAIVAGDYFRAGTATTAAIYKVVSSTVGTGGGTLTLDMPLQAAVNLVGNTAEYITAAQAATMNCGIKMVGQALSFKAGKFNDEVVMWETQLVDFEDTTETFKSTAATRGSGTVNQLKQMEWFTQGFEGEYMREKFSETFTPRTNTDASVAGGGYDLIRITFETKNTVGFQTNTSHQAITLAVPATPGANSYAIAGVADDITDVLEVLAFGSATVALAIS
jgi:hypothetical protein